MLIITDSSLYLFPIIAEKSGIKIDSVVAFPLANTDPLLVNNKDILILLSEFYYKQISKINSEYDSDKHQIDYALEGLDEIVNIQEQIGKRIFFSLIPNHYLYSEKYADYYSYGDSSNLIINKINFKIINKLKKRKNIIFLKGIEYVKESIAKEYFRFSSIYSKQYSQLIIDQILYFSKQQQTKKKKLIILDLDDTLWKGIVGEVSISGIRMDPSDHIGSIFYQVQRILLNLKNKGVLLAICSKNDENIALEALFNHPSSQFKKEDIVTYKINWKEKSSNIIEICQELNLSVLDTLFIDDNPHECEEVRKNCKGISILKVPSNLYQYPTLILEEASLFTGISTQEDLNRTNKYKNGVERKKLLKQTLNTSGTKLEWLESLKTKLFIKKIEKENDNLLRIIQLFNRTNQFHLSTKKFNLQSFTDKLDNSNTFYYQGIVTDRLGSEGIISVIGFKIDDQKNNIYLIDYILSCRVFGRGIEEAMLIPILEYALYKSYKIKINLKKSSRNIPIQNFIDRKISHDNELSLIQIKRVIQEFKKFPIEINLEDIFLDHYDLEKNLFD